MQDRVLQARGRQAGSLEDLEPEIRDQSRFPLFQRRACSLVDEESLLAVQQEGGGSGRGLGHRVDRTYNGKVIVPSWSVRRTLGGKPVARRPGPRDAMSCVVGVSAALSRSGDSRLRPPLGSTRSRSQA